MGATTRRYLSLTLSLLLPALMAPSLAQASQSEYDKVYAKYMQCRDTMNQRCAYTYAGEALRLAEQLYPRPNKNLALLAHDFGSLTLYNQQPEQAFGRLQHALSLSDEAFGAQSAESFQVLLDLLDAESKSSDERISEDERHWKRALEVAETMSGGKPLAYADNLLVIGSFLTLSDDEERVQNGRLIHSEAYDIYIEQAGINDLRTGVTALQIGKAYSKVGQNEPAINWFDRALASIEGSGKPSSQIALATHELLVTTYEHMGKSRKANKHCIAVGKILSASPDAELKPLYEFSPAFSEEDLLDEADEGYIVVKFNVSKTGQVKDPELFDSNVSSDAQKMALNALKRFRYPPKFRDGKAVETFGVTHRFEVTPSS